MTHSIWNQVLLRKNHGDHRAGTSCIEFRFIFLQDFPAVKCLRLSASLFPVGISYKESCRTTMQDYSFRIFLQENSSGLSQPKFPQKYSAARFCRKIAWNRLNFCISVSISCRKVV